MAAIDANHDNHSMSSVPPAISSDSHLPGSPLCVAVGESLRSTAPSQRCPPGVATALDRPGSAGHRWGLALLTVAVVAHFSTLPLAHTDLWGHLAYGRIIAGYGLPAHEPLQRPGMGIPFVDTAWLSQWGAFVLADRFGWAALQWTQALVMASGAIVLGATAFRLTAWRPALWLAPAGWLVLAWFPWQVIRPQLLGIVLFLLVLWLLSAPRAHWWRPLVFAGLFAVWANLHGSFPLGWLALLAAGWEQVLRGGTISGSVGEFPDQPADSPGLPVGRSSPSGQSAAALFAGELSAAVAGTLINPWGWKLWPAVIAVSRHPNVADLTEWQPLRWDRPQGWWLAGAVCLLLVLGVRWLWILRFPPRGSGDLPWRTCAASPGPLRLATTPLWPTPLWPLALTLVLVGATSLSARYLVWTAATLPLSLLLLIRFPTKTPAVFSGDSRVPSQSPQVPFTTPARASQRDPGESDRKTGAAPVPLRPGPPARAMTDVSEASTRQTPLSRPVPHASLWAELRPALGSLVVAVVGLSPPVCHWATGREREGTGEVVSDTPVAEAGALQRFASLCEGPVVAPLTWGDYLLFSLPDGPAPFVASHVHWLPPEDWRDHLEMLRGDERGWETLTRRGFKTVLLDRQTNHRLLARLTRDPHWQPLWGDTQAVLLVKTDAAVGDSATPSWPRLGAPPSTSPSDPRQE